MEEIKTDLFPGNLRAGKKRERGAEKASPQKNAVEYEEPLPETSRPRRDGPGGE